jgi:hypothetical protein
LLLDPFGRLQDLKNIFGAFFLILLEKIEMDMN